MTEDAKKPLGRILLKQRSVTQPELDRALEGASPGGPPLASRLTESGTLSEIDALKALSEQSGVPGIDLNQICIRLSDLSILPREVALRHKILPVLVREDRVFCAMASPTETKVIDELEFVTGKRVFPYIALAAPLLRTIHSAYEERDRGEVYYAGPTCPPETLRKAGFIHSTPPPAPEPPVRGGSVVGPLPSAPAPQRGGSVVAPLPTGPDDPWKPRTTTPTRPASAMPARSPVPPTAAGRPSPAPPPPPLPRMGAVPSSQGDGAMFGPRRSSTRIEEVPAPAAPPPPPPPAPPPGPPGAPTIEEDLAGFMFDDSPPAKPAPRPAPPPPPPAPVQRQAPPPPPRPAAPPPLPQRFFPEPVVMDDQLGQMAAADELTDADFGVQDRDVSVVMSLPTESARPGPPVAGQQTILVVDDEPDIRKLVRRSLEGRGFRVREADRGHVALNMLKEQAPDLIVLDAMLPEVHGFDIARRIKGTERYGHIPIVMISAVYRGWRFAEDIKASYGVDAYIEKPFKIADLMAAIDTALAKKPPPQNSEQISADAERMLAEGIAAYQKGEILRAVEYLKEGTRIDPLAYRLHFHLGLLYGKQGQLYDAIQELQRALDINGSHFPALKNLAVLYQKAGFRNKAIETWERALRVAPDDPTRQSIKEHLVGLL